MLQLFSLNVVESIYGTYLIIKIAAHFACFKSILKLLELYYCWTTIFLDIFWYSRYKFTAILTELWIKSDILNIKQNDTFFALDKI